MKTDKIRQVVKKTPLFFLFFYLTSCISDKLIPINQQLYIGSRIKIDSNGIKNKALKEDLSAVVFPRPNSSFLGLKPKLWIYFKASEMKENRWSRWLKNKVGEAPVLMEQIDPESLKSSLKNKIYNYGYFNSKVDYHYKIRKRKVKVIYTVNPAKPYYIKEVYFPSLDNILTKNIIDTKNKTLLKPGKQFDLDLIKQESSRIEMSLKNEGFYFFQASFLKFKIDSSLGNNTLNIYVVLKPDLPQNTKIKYNIRNIHIDATHELGANADLVNNYIELDKPGYFYLDKQSHFNSFFIVKAINFKPNDTYSKQKHDITLSHLMALGTFKFVNINFQEIGIDSANNRGIMDLYVYLTPLKKNTIRLELNLVSKTNNFAGPGFDLTYKNKNTFKGAEFYTLRLNTGFETQITSYQKGLNSFILGLDNEFSFPRFFSPIPLPNISYKFVPKTKIKLGYQILDRINFYRLTSINTIYGFDWNESVNKKHELNPIAINFVDLSHQSSSFKTLLQGNSILKNSFENQFISGGMYTYIYNNQLDDSYKNHTYFNANLDISGNSFYLFQSVFQSSAKVMEQPYKIFSLAYSQYSRIELDYRHYPLISNKSKLAFRTILGFGTAYGNSDNLPYIKQFYIGGTNSIRAFLPRSIGPGSVLPGSNGSGNLFIDQTGDLKLESNLEYRFDISKIFKGAVFLDGGNIWQIHRRGILPGAKFQLNDFYRKLALGTGAGLRLDFSYFLIRLDWAFPLRVPYLVDSWVLSKINFLKSEWRRENLVLNIAIGYPF